MLHRADWYTTNYVSKNRSSFVFRVKKSVYLLTTPQKTWTLTSVFVLLIRLFTESHLPNPAVTFQYQNAHCISHCLSLEYLAHLYYYVQTYFAISADVKCKSTLLRGGADKSLARPTSRCRRTESIVSLERGVWSCAELQAFSCYRGWKEAWQATGAISTTSTSQLSSSFFFPARQGTEGNSGHSDRNIRGTCTIVCHRQKLGGPV